MEPPITIIIPMILHAICAKDFTLESEIFSMLGSNRQINRPMSMLIIIDIITQNLI